MKTDGSGAKTCHLSIRMDKSQIEAFVNFIWKTPLQFDALRADHDSLKMWLPPDEASQFTSEPLDDFYENLTQIALAAKVTHVN